MRHYTQPFIHDIRELMAMGRIHNRNHPDLLASEVAAGAPMMSA
jgi:long-chain acyl-CoA synthetase